MNYRFPTLSYDYRYDYTGTLNIVDDLGGDSDTGLLGWLSKLWDWICNFFETLKNMIIGLFVPEDGYFQQWVQSIKTAFEAKLGGLGALVDSVSNGFKSLGGSSVKDSSLVLKMPDNQLFQGYQGITVDMLASAKPIISWLRGLFNGILVVITVILCQRKLTAIIKGAES